MIIKLPWADNGLLIEWNTSRCPESIAPEMVLDEAAAPHL